MRVAGSAILVLYYAIANGSPANAAGNADAAAGVIADRCTSCHKVPGYEARWERANVNAPPFDEIARKRDVYTDQRLRTFLRKPHWPMTQFVLSQRDIDNIIAFIDRLR